MPVAWAPVRLPSRAVPNLPRILRTQLALVAAVTLVAISGCGGGAQRADTDVGSASPPAAAAPPRLIAGGYALQGRERRVRTTVTPVLITTTRRNDAIPTPRGRHQVQVDLRLDDRGHDRLDPQILSFSARDGSGASVGEAFRQPIRTLEADDPGSPRLLSVGFLLPRGRSLAQLRLRSIVDRLPLRLRWDL
jgi:hypothetical protein